MFGDKSRYSINIRGSLLDFSKPRIMGVLNITPDSFYKGSRLEDEDRIIRKASAMLEEGADILDIGGYSSRPGAEHISEKEEWERLEMALRIIRSKYSNAVISVDTFRASIAERAVNDYGIDMINDITAGDYDPDMFNVIARFNLPYIIMHMKGNPQNMQKNPAYKDILAELLKWFSEKKQMLVSMGIKDIIIDPGFGFGKTVEHNFILLSKLERFRILDLPLLVGLSRKSMIWKTLDITPEESLTGTIALNAFSLVKGASILRVHDVKEAVHTIKLISSILNS